MDKKDKMIAELTVALIKKDKLLQESFDLVDRYKKLTDEYQSLLNQEMNREGQGIKVGDFSDFEDEPFAKIPNVPKEQRANIIRS